MKKKILKKRTILILMLILFLLAIAVGYAALSQPLNINGTANVISEWNVKITGIIPASTNSDNGATDKLGSPSFTENTATFNVDLAYPGAASTYTVTVKNEGNIKAELTGIEGITFINSQEPTGIQFSSNAVVGDILEPDESVSYTINVQWDSNQTAIPDNKTKTATIQFTYTQAN